MERIEVLKTYKIFIGGQFPRTESGRYYPLKLKNNMTVNVSLSSRKDFRNAVVVARSAFSGVQERPLIADKYYIALLKCWKDAKSNF
jgi:hypothetical protein